MSLPDATWTPRGEWLRRTHELRASGVVIVQICVGATLAWVLATQIVGHAQPFFAPIAAVISVTSGLGHRRRVLVELAAGVAIGILVGELLLGLIGRGSWQLALVIVIVASIAVLLDIGRLATIQACTSAILLVTVVPTTDSVQQVALDRFVDALIGGAVGLLVSTALAPDPVRVLERDVGAVLSELADLLGGSATALRWNDAGVAWTALQQGRALEGPLRRLGDTAASSEELASIWPLRWRQREHVLLYTSSLRYVDHAVRDARVLTRRIHTMLRRGYTDGVAAAPALQQLAGAVQLFADDLAEQHRFDEVRQTLVGVSRRATAALSGDASLGLTVVVAQTRALAADLLYATGTTAEELDDLLD